MAGGLHREEGTFLFRQDRNLSPLHLLEPRTKVIALVGFIGLATGLKAFSLLAAGIFFLGLLITLSGLSWRRLAGRFIWVAGWAVGLILLLPLTTPGEPWRQLALGPWGFTFSREGGERALLLVLRLINALLAGSLLVGTTPFDELMLALRGLRLPPVLVQLIELTVRYFWVVGEELRRMYWARKARCLKEGKSLAATYTFYALGQLIGALFLRSWQRSERIYQAMLARGYHGPCSAARPAISPAGKDLAWGLGILGMALGLRLLEIGGWIWSLSSR